MDNFDAIRLFDVVTGNRETLNEDFWDNDLFQENFDDDELETFNDNCLEFKAAISVNNVRIVSETSSGMHLKLKKKIKFFVDKATGESVQYFAYYYLRKIAIGGGTGAYKREHTFSIFHMNSESFLYMNASCKIKRTKSKTKGKDLLTKKTFLEILGRISNP